MTPNGFVHFAGGGEPGRRLAVKDNIDVAGMPCAGGMEALRGRIAQRDAPCVARLKAAGYTVVGKTLMDEAAFGATGDNPWFGRCHNPLRQGYTPGGSSAGSAAAVAAGLCDVALGTDTLGSVRIPASYCGVVGYLPGRGLIDNAGVKPLMPEYDRVGVLARSVAQAARVASIMAGKGLEPQAGASIGELDGIDWGALRRAALLLVEVEAARLIEGKVSETLRVALEFGRTASPERIARAREQIEEAKRHLNGLLEKYDVLVLPTTPQTAFPFDAPVPPTQADFTVPASVAGLAAISVPAGERDGLPLGTQVIGRDDARVLGVAATLG